MMHVDALNRNSLLCNMLIDESEESIVARIQKAQRDDVNLQNIYLLANERQSDGYVVRGGLLFKEIKGDI